MTRCEVRWATAEDIDKFYGGRPRQTVRAIVALVGGEPAGVIGLAQEAGWTVAFSDMKPAIGPHLRSLPVLFAIKEIMRLIRQSPGPVVAVANPDIEGSADTLRKFGFERIGRSDEGEVFQWQA